MLRNLKIEKAIHSSPRELRSVQGQEKKSEAIFTSEKINACCFFTHLYEI